jgi:uncharacterized protein (TIGR03437 family)
VQVNGLAAFLQAVTPTRLVVLTPSDVTTGQVNVQVTNNGLVSDAFSVAMASEAPALFTSDGKYLVMTHGTGVLSDRLDVFPSTSAWPVVTWPVSAAAQPGESISFYGTGFGVTDPAIVDGQLQVNPSNTATPVTLTVGGEQASVSFAGLAPGFAGIYQFTVTIPSDLANGDQAVVVTMNGLTTPQSDKCCFVQVRKSASGSSQDVKQ